MIDTTFEEFAERARQGTFVPVCREVMADLLTPVAAFLKVAEDADHAFLLESVAGGERLARYSFLGKDPFMVLRAQGERTIVDTGARRQVRDEPFMAVLREVLAQYRSPPVPELPRFTGGAVGFFGYEAAAWFEPAFAEPSATAADGAGAWAAADAGFMLFDTVLAFDHVKCRILIIANAHVDDGADLRARYDLARANISVLERELERPISMRPAGAAAPLAWRSNTTRAAYEAAVARGQEHIRAGDIYQVVLSQRFETDVTVDPCTVYRTLRYINPSPYMYLMKIGGLSIVGSSPEMLVRVEGAPSRRIRSPARARAGARWTRTRRSRMRSGRTRRNGPST